MTSITRVRASWMTLALAACGPLGGCATKRYAGSSVVSLPAGLQGKVGGRKASLEIEGLKVRIEAAGQEAEAGENPRVSLQLRFDPQELGYSFDPARVVVRGGEGREWRPEVPSGYRPLVPGSTFGLSFDVETAPASRLSLVLDGLARGAKRLEPVVLPIGPRTWSSIERVYWLEILLAPLALAGGGM